MSKKNLTPNHDKCNDTEIRQAYWYIETIKNTADNEKTIMWHGWALREAFLAGVQFQKENKNNP